jgi:signal-transduction protein with cAMP-binding, CBS, and nucleotidyltransferase domain
MRRRSHLAIVVIALLMVGTSIVSTSPRDQAQAADPLAEAKAQQKALEATLSAQRAALAQLKNKASTLAGKLDAARADVFHEMSSKRLGMTCVVDEDGRLVGIFTDGDLRRLMSRESNVLALSAKEAMTPDPVTIGRDLLAVEALKVMETHKITSVVVVSEHHRVEGVVHLHDLWRTQMF